jgi:outer membrane protein assembly factor BamB
MLATLTVGLPTAFGETTSVVTLTPRTGPPTTRTTVTGSGFGSNETVAVLFDGRAVGSTNTDPDGTFTASVRVPASAPPGNHLFVATGRTSHAHGRAGFLVRTNWYQFHFGPAHQGVNPYENVLSPSTVGGLTINWSVATEGLPFTSPAVVAGVVYLGTDGPFPSTTSRLYAFDAKYGRLLWRHVERGELISDVSVAYGLVYVGTDGDASVYAYDAETGAQVWRFQGDGPMSTPTVSDGVVYVGAALGRLHAIDAMTGEEIWHVEFGINATPTVAGGRVYVALDGGSVHCLDARTGTELWSQDGIGLFMTSSPAVADGVVYLGSDDGNVYAFDALNGALKWIYDTGAPVTSSPTVWQGRVYIGLQDPSSSLLALDEMTGDKLWSAPTGYPFVLSSPTVANGVVYVGTDRPYAFDALTGKQLWSTAGSNQINATPAVADGVMYIGAFNNRLYAYSLP